MKKRQKITRPMLERIVIIHNKIKEQTYPSTSKLAKEIEVGTATISRDIDFLRDKFLAPIAYDSVNRGYYYVKPFELPINVLSSNGEVCYNEFMKKRQTLTRPMLERIVIIHDKIKSGLYPSTPKLAKDLEVGTATISRDVDFLRDRFYAPIDYDASKKGYFYSEPFELPLNVLSASDMEVLTSAKILLSHFEGTPIHDQLCSIIDYLAPNDKNNNPMIDRIAIPPVKKSFYDREIWTDIYNAMKTNQIIEFDYKGLWREEVTHRRVHPYQLVMDDGQVYLLGYSEEREAERIFSLTRMNNMIITEDTFTLPENYDFSKRCDGGRFGFFFQENKTEFKIRFFGVSKQVVKERLWADDQKIKDNGSYVDLTFTSNQQIKILHWILSLGYTVKPLEPEWFVKSWKETISKMAGMAGIK